MNFQFPNKKFSGLKDKSIKSVKSTTVPILTSVNVPNPNIIESNELKTPIMFDREKVGKRIESKKGNMVNLTENVSLETSFIRDPRKVPTKKKGDRIGIFGVN